MYRSIFTAITLLALAGCANWAKPYKIEITQGNIVNKEVVARLQPGMTKAQVEYLLGTPLVHDMLHENRWDYLYVKQRDFKTEEREHLVVFFKDDKLTQIRTQNLPEHAKEF